MGIEVDVTHHEAVSAMVTRVVQEWGRIDVLVANAGGGRGRPVDTKASTLARIIHGSSVRSRSAVGEDVVLRGVGDACNRGLRLRRGVCAGASGPVAHGGNLAMRAARLEKPAW
ncbi:MAG TPA: SDR family NAD(P)-dependent oxidoreductase [Bradyrhizobium sp.]|nr:SDR family NAD(P)-dependent oxidoreductase [Bradyrhizobium sp.]